VQQEPEEFHNGQNQFHSGPDQEFHNGPDQVARDGAISSFLQQLKVQEQLCYTGLGDVLSSLPLPITVDQPGLSVQDAMEAGMLQQQIGASVQFHNMNVQVYWATIIPYLSFTYP
jgi:hypothetical protein